MKPIKPVEKPEKRQKIVDKYWPGVSKPGDGKFIFSQETSPAQVEYYCNFISGYLGSTGLFFEQNRHANELKLEITFSRYFKRLRKCNTALFPNFKELRGEANIWVNSNWQK